MRYFSFRKITFSRGINAGRYWQDILISIKRGQYDGARIIIERWEHEGKYAERPDLKIILKAAWQICLTCSQLKSEGERHYISYQETYQREQNLQQELEKLVRQLMEWDLVQERAEGISTNHSVSKPAIADQEKQKISDLFQSLKRRIRLFLKTKSPLHPKRPPSESLLEIPDSTEKVSFPEDSASYPSHNLYMPQTEGRDEGYPEIPYMMVYFLGSFQVFQGEERITEWESYKARDIFKYLLVNRIKPVMKDTLMETFWPDAAPEAAPRNLHQAIYSLRQTLRGKQPEFQHICFENDCYFYNPNLKVWLDFEEFENQIQAARHLEATGNLVEAIENYDLAESIYQGDFLEEDLYEEWPRLKRTQLQIAYLDVANRLTNHYRQLHEYPSAITLCRKIISYDRCNEKAHRQLIRCYLAQGQRQLALRQYLTCIATLQEDLGLSPSTETLELHRQITG